MKSYEVKYVFGGKPKFDEDIDKILSRCKQGGALQILDPKEYLTDRQRRWYKGVCLPFLAKNDENQETVEWWDTEVKRLCGGLAYLKKEIFFLEDKRAVGRLTTKNVGKKKMTLFINEIIAQSVARGWGLTAPDAELRGEKNE
jgi:hypothetical protein